ncbi:MAG: response regulator, partial [Holophaga sp.]|nr:response regulator [Holophaga sp.]
FGFFFLNVKGAEPGRPFSDVLAKVLAGVDHAQLLLNPLFMLFSPSSPRMESASLNEVVQECAGRVEGEAAAAGVSMELSLDPALQPTALDTGMVREAVLCLLRTGIRASARSAAKRLRVGTRQTSTGQQLVAQDTGPALSEADSRRIFDLAQATDVDSLGMCVVASVAKAHGGKVTVRSQEGLGNAYLVELSMAHAPSPSAPANLEGARILVVDDEQFLLECLVDAIESWGCQVTPCSLAAEAIQKLQGGTYDLIVSDIRMPGLSGIQLFEWIREHQAAMASRILFTTGDSFDPETRAFLEQARLPHLGKPFDLKKLRQAISDLKASNA